MKAAHATITGRVALHLDTFFYGKQAWHADVLIHRVNTMPGTICVERFFCCWHTGSCFLFPRVDVALPRVHPIINPGNQLLIQYRR